MIDANRIIGLLAEPARRRVVAALILEAGDVVDLADRTGLDLRSVVDALDRLTGAGLVEVGADGVHVILESAFEYAARTAHESANPAPPAPSTEDEQILRRSIVDGRLVHLPRKRSRRLVVLDNLAQAFEPGVRYDERTVNATLRAFDDDVATLRRYMVDEGFLDRAEGTYWRSGGSVTTDGA